MSARIPRLQLDDMPEELRQYLYDTKVKRLGYLGEFFQVAANNPDVLLRFMQFTDALGVALPKKLAEVVALTVAGWMRNVYERNQHERLCEKLGFPRDWIAAVNRLAPESSAELAPDERSVQKYTLAALERRGAGVRGEFDAMLAHISPAQAMAVAMLVGRCICHALVVNTLELRPPAESAHPTEAAAR